MASSITIPALAALGATQQFNKRALSVSQPNDRSAVHHIEALRAGADKRVEDIAPGAQELLSVILPVKPDANNLPGMASHTKSHTSDGRDASLIKINPNADAAYLAHELGHGVSQKTGIGKFINNARHTLASHPKLGNALAQGLLYSSPVVAAALQEGDDDLAASMAIAAGIASPTLIDEALASKNALAIMDNAGMRATLGQRGRLAGGYLSYLAPVLLAGSVGNTVGNFADDHTAIYDL